MDEVASFLALPIHPLFVHFPVAMFSMTWLLTVWRHATGSTRFVGLAESLELIGVAFLPATLLTGLRDADWGMLITEARLDQPMIWHAALGAVIAALMTTHYVWRRRATRAGRPAAGIDLGVLSVAFWLLVLTGLLAGEMVYG